IYWNNSHFGYNLIFLHPLVYLTVFVLVLSKATFGKRIRIFFLIFSFNGFLRYVLLPFFIVMSGYYGGRSRIPPSIISIRLAVILMIYEMIIVGIVLFIYENKRKATSNLNIKNSNKDTNTFYYIFIFITLVVLFIRPSVFNQISFLIPSFGRVELNTFDNFILYSFNISKNLLYILFIKYLYRQYKIKKSEVYIILSIIFSLINTIIYVGSSRIDVIFPAVVSIIILMYFYRFRVLKYVFIIVPIVIFIFSAMTEYRNYSSITGNTNYLIEITDILQVYT